ncbi:hypothetical protein ABPG72_021546 [Tetrahymena utriculariae]
MEEETQQNSSTEESYPFSFQELDKNACNFVVGNIRMQNSFNLENTNLNNQSLPEEQEEEKIYTQTQEYILSIEISEDSNENNRIINLQYQQLVRTTASTNFEVNKQSNETIEEYEKENQRFQDDQHNLNKENTQLIQNQIQTDSQYQTIDQNIKQQIQFI